MVTQISKLIVTAFPIVLLFVSGIGFLFPEKIIWFKGPWITYSLGAIMLGMGLTLEAADFIRILKQPKSILIGTILQYTIMPTLGYFLGHLFQLPEAFAVGLILVSCCPGGTASNVIAFLSKADVPLSVTLTSVSTILGILMTPLLVAFLIGSRLEIDRLGLIFTTFQVILVPVGLGLFLKTNFPKLTKEIQEVFPVLSVLLIAMIVASIIASGKETILQSDFRIFFAVILLHLGGFGFGGIFSWYLTKNAKTAKTISIEVGMQNSGLGAVLARTHFLDPNTAIPSALSSLTHSLLGSLFATYFRKESKKPTIVD
ncbi:bile acid:sodium symporter family protein [Leptospira sp. 2 VSF19]|uniref:Bile acid:sodium symporter family protein n=1 Tax=Leptospira soteropolitanensis TaxID=2950025 RepID=A0AAW5VCP3_9LEPT|nr:bile acid:sodium symporter family protein [Leptospira soteropolitanensis]MCW7492602.1 bile acid:sodium symporter family protein [Leptospira soteropolitanensis]MCW7500285.1 bile acid:sodium symporter family protein [Leptospira soteropolitanensis]MCW7522680.1 bile acid:sodium symporter family protein [Leptospira soteropolitanensis]MCW7526536.1 bile acid:sodium symporter family protein [Leptospira soteropolitanensis]MCW7530255.1 bile acid:sodium symporter family protein [Leptospira soteropolit